MPEKSTMGTITNSNVEQALVKPVITQPAFSVSDWPHSKVEQAAHSIVQKRFLHFRWDMHLA